MRELAFVTLSWSDIIFPRILPLLEIEDFFRLRCVSKDFLELVDQYFAQNRILDLRHAKRYTERAFKIMTESTASLKYLDLTGSKVVTDSLLRQVLMNNPCLTYLNLSECHHCTSGILQTMTIRNRNIERLILHDCHWVSRRSIEYHASHQGVSNITDSKLSKLREINLTGCWELTDDVLITFFAQFPDLKVVKLGNIYSLTDCTMQALAQYTRELEVLDIRGCWRVSDIGLRLVSEYCWKLKLLSVMDCRSVTERSLKSLRERGVLIDRKLDETLARLDRMRVQFMHDRLVI